MTTTITEPGVYDGIPEDTYHADRSLAPTLGRSLSSTGAKTLLDCPARFAWQRDHPIVKDAFRAVGALNAHGHISPNRVRALLADYDVPGHLVGQVYRTLRRATVISYDGLTEISDDVAGGNAGKIHRTYVWVGAR